MVTLGGNASLSGQRDTDGFLCGASTIFALGFSLVYLGFTTSILSRTKTTHRE